MLKPILLVSDGVADTSELFLRSYQMYKMFSGETSNRTRRARATTRKASIDVTDYTDADVYKELKIGQLAQKILGPMLIDGYATDEEITAMQTLGYSKRNFDLQFPLLVEENSDFEHKRYYKPILVINGKRYRMCSQWFETTANNDRPYLLKWIKEHSTK